MIDRRFDWARLNDMSTFLRQRSATGVDAAQIKRADFRSLMDDFFGRTTSDCRLSLAFSGVLCHRISIIIVCPWMFTGFHDEMLTGAMFDTMDTNASGTIDFKELLTGLSTALRGSPEQRLDFYFSLYDMDGSGSIDDDEIYRLLERGHSSMGNMNSESAKGLLDQYGLSDLDADGDGHISHEEFIQAVKKHPEIMKVFGEVVH